MPLPTVLPSKVTCILADKSAAPNGPDQLAVRR
jgi:hypothetical protein